MQSPFQQSAASAHVDDLMRAAQSHRLAADGRPRHRRRTVSFGAVRAVAATTMRKTQHA
jgi:hypothetical protein